MATQLTRRETLTRGAAAAMLLALPDWALPALAQGEVDVAFTDYPDTFAASPPNGERRFLDLRKIDGLITPNDQFFFIQHYNKPELDPATHRIKVTGLVKKPLELSLADLQGDAVGRHRQRLRVLGQQRRARCRGCRRTAGSPACGCATC